LTHQQVSVMVSLSSKFKEYEMDGHVTRTV